MSKIDYYRYYEELEEDAVKESRKPKTKPKKSWKKVKPELNKKGYDKQWKNKRRNGSLEKKNRKNTNS